MNKNILHRRHSLVFAAVVLASFGSVAAQAADPLVWKFTPGLTNRYRMTQETKVEKTGAGGEATLNSQMIMDMSWTVREVKADGSAVLEQRITRMRMTMSTGDGQKAQIDTAAKEDPQGSAALLAPLVKALTGNSFIVTMTPRGKVTDVKVPEAIAEALKNQPGAAQMGDLATAEGFKKLVSQAAFVLPEKLDPGAEWSAKTEAALEAIGTQTATTTYRYEGLKEVDGKPLERFTAKVNVKFSGGQVPVEVTRQESSGEILFNREAGRLEASHIELETDMKTTMGEEVAVQKVDQTVDVKWLPEDAE